MKNLKLFFRQPWLIPTIFFAVFVILGANMHPLWGDEAETALFARNILTYGVPKGWDGVNIMGNQDGIVLNKSLINHTSPWAQYYLTALSFRLFGQTTFTARLPFILFSILIIPLAYYLAINITREKKIASLTAIILSLSVPFALFSYQARYYSLTIFLGLAFVLTSLFLIKKNIYPKLFFVLTGVFFFYSNYVVFFAFYVSTFISISIYHFLYKKENLKRFVSYFLFLTLFIILFTLPWYLIFRPLQNQGSLIPFNLSQIPSLVNPFFTMLREALITYSENNAFPVLFVPILVWLIWDARKDVKKISDIILVFAIPVIFVVMTLLFTIYSNVVTYFTEARYTMAAFPFFVIGSACVVYNLTLKNKYLGALILFLYLTTNIFTLNPLRSFMVDFAKEVINPYVTSDQAVATYLEKNAKNGDTIFLSLDRDHEPLIFYLKDKVRFVNRISAPNSRVFPENRSIVPRYIYAFSDLPDWIILYSKRGKDDTAFTIDYRPIPPNINLDKDYHETVLPVFFSDMTRPELYLRLFTRIEPTYDDQIFIYSLKK